MCPWPQNTTPWPLGHCLCVPSHSPFVKRMFAQPGESCECNDSSLPQTTRSRPGGRTPLNDMSPGPIFHAHHREATVASTKTGARWAPLTGFCLRHFFKVRSDRQRTILRKAKSNLGVSSEIISRLNLHLLVKEMAILNKLVGSNLHFCFLWSDLRKKCRFSVCFSVQKPSKTTICLAPPIHISQETTQ